MTDRDSPTAAATHKVVDVLLPMFVNGTLDDDERALVERHLRECTQCSGEVDWLRELYAACVTVEGSPEGSRAARRLRRQLDTSRSSPSPRVRAEWRWAAAGAFAAAVALSTVWLIGAPDTALYRTLAAQSSQPSTGAIVVVFDPAVSEFDLRRIVRSAGARIVDGPTQTNAYLLDVPAERRAQALLALRAERAVVLAERIDSRGR